MLKEFYAVSVFLFLYRVTCDEHGFKVETIASLDPKKHYRNPSSRNLADRLGIKKNGCGLVNYLPQHYHGGHPQPARMTNTAYYGEKTAEIVALFLYEEEAKACLVAGPGFAFWDRRWQNQTIDTIRAISDNHGWFIPDNELLDMAGIDYTGNPARH